MIRSYLILISVLLAGLCGVVHAGEIIDMAGRNVTVPDVIRSVFSASPPATCMVHAVAPDLVAGLNYACRIEERKYMPPRMQRLPVVGGWFGQGQTPNLETLMQVGPDIILVRQSKTSASGDKIEKTLAPLGIPIVFIRIDTLADYPKVFEFLGKLFNREQRAHALGQYARETLSALSAIRAVLADGEKIPIYYAEGMDGASTECSASVHAELIPLCGGKNVHVFGIKEGFGMEKISVEQVIRYDPQVILVREPAFYDRVYKDPRWRNIRAVYDNRVFLIPRAPFNWFDRPPSFMRLLGARWLMNRLYPDKYPVEMIEETRAFYRLFLNTSLDRKAAGEILHP